MRRFLRAGVGSHGSLEKTVPVSLLSIGHILPVSFSPQIPLAAHPPSENVAVVLRLAEPPGGVENAGSYHRRVRTWLYRIVMVVSVGFAVVADAILAPVWRIAVIQVRIWSGHHLPALGRALRGPRSVVTGGIAHGMMPALLFMYHRMRKDEIALPFDVRDTRVILLASVTAV